MRYEIVLSVKAARQFESLDVVVASGLAEHFDRLAEDPVGLSQPSYLPYPPGYQLFKCHVGAANGSHYFAILFNYSQDETSLLISGIGHRDTLGGSPE